MKYYSYSEISKFIGTGLYIDKAVAAPQPANAVASVGVFDGNKLLMGRRKDSNKWTLPGGHFEAGEYAREAGIRELYEEAGIEAHALTPLGMKPVKTPEGMLDIHAFEYHCSKTPTVKNDPDEEVKKWEWIDVSNGVPRKILGEMHSKKNVVLMLLGLQKSMELFIVEPEYFIGDLAKARPHKYLRKFRKGGKWVYIYHQGDEHGKIVSAAQQRKLETLKETGHEPTKRLLDTAEEHKSENIKRLAELHEAGHAPATEWLRRHGLLEHVEQKGIEHVIDPERANDPFLRDLTSDQKARVTHEIEVALQSKIFGYLDSHRTTPFYTNMQRDGVSVSSIMEKVEVESSMSEIISTLDRELNKLDRSHAGLTSQNSAVTSAGGYANLGFNEAINRLVGASALPEAAKPMLKRTAANRGRLGIDTASLKRAQEQEELRKRAETDRLRQEHGEIVDRHGESLRKMMSYFSHSLNQNGQVNLMKGMDKLFGKDFKFQKFIDHFQGHQDVEIKIRSSFMDGLIAMGAGTGQRTVTADFDLVERSSGRKITSANRYITKTADGGIVWHNSVFNRAKNEDLKRYPGMATGLYGGVERFLREVTANHSPAAKKSTLIEIGSAANSGFGNGYKGALVWTKHYFDFSDDRRESSLSSWKAGWKGSLDQMGRSLGLSPSAITEIKAKIDTFKYPYQFTTTGIVLDKETALRALGKSSFDFDFNQLLKKRSKGGRTGYLDLGELIIISRGSGWGPAKNYIHRTTERSKHLNELRAKAYAGQRASIEQSFLEGGPRTTAQPQRTPAGGENRATRAIRVWSPSGRNRNIAITESRLRMIKQFWSDDEASQFVRSAPLTANGRIRVRAILDDRRRG